MANGDLGSLILFGSVLAWAVIDRISLKRRTDPGAPPIPVGGMRNDVIAIFGGIALYARARLVVPSLCDRRARLRRLTCRASRTSSG